MSDIQFFEDRVTGRLEPFRFDPNGPTWVHLSGAGQFGPGAFRERFKAPSQPSPDVEAAVTVLTDASVPPPSPAPDFAGMSHRELQKAAKLAGVSAGGTSEEIIARLEGQDGTET